MPAKEATTGSGRSVSSTASSPGALSRDGVAAVPKDNLPRVGQAVLPHLKFFMHPFAIPVRALFFLSLIALCGCEDLVPRDTSSLLIPRFTRSEILGFVAGLGTTFAAVPDLIAMFRSRSAAGPKPRMAAILGVFQILWVYYGLLIASRPVIAWNVIAVFINFLNVGAYRYFARRSR